MCGRATAVAVLMLGFAGAAAAADEVFQHPVQAAELLRTTLAAPAKELSDSKVLTGQFVQRRFLKGIPRPLASHGDFILARDRGVYWHTLEPFVSELTLTRKGLILRDEDTGVKRATPREQPALRMAMDVFAAMFSLDVTLLQRNFNLFSVERDGKWQLGLKPRQSRLAKAFKEAVITGAKTVERIELRAGEGDRTEIELSGVESRSTELTAEEQQRFP